MSSAGGSSGGAGAPDVSTAGLSYANLDSFFAKLVSASPRAAAAQCAHVWQAAPAHTPAHPCTAGKRPPHIRANHAPRILRCTLQRQHAHADPSPSVICGAQTCRSRQQCARSIAAVTPCTCTRLAAAPRLPPPGSHSAVAGSGGVCVLGGGGGRWQRLQPFYGVPEAAAAAAGHAAAAGELQPPPAHCNSFMPLRGRFHWCWEGNRRRLLGSSSSSSSSSSSFPMSTVPR